MNTRNGINGSGRYYIVDPKSGLALPSVTTILSEMGDKSGLNDWVNRVGQEEADRVSKFSANRGTYMHALHEHYLDCRFVKKLENPLMHAFKSATTECQHMTDEELKCGKTLFFQFFQTQFYEEVEEILFQEVPVWSLKGGGYAGRLDLSLKTKDLKKKIVDFKTSRKPKRDEWILGYKKQTAAYSVGLYEQYGIFPDQCEIWISCESGEVQTFTITQEEMKHYFNEFYKDVVGYHKKYPLN